MDEEIAWHVELVVEPGQLEDLRTLTNEMIESTQDETGILDYHRFVSEGGGVIHIYERYENSAAAAAHMRVFRERFSLRFSALVKRRRFTVFGNPSAELRELLNTFGAEFPKPFGAAWRSHRA